MTVRPPWYSPAFLSFLYRFAILLMSMSGVLDAGAAYGWHDGSVSSIGLAVSPLSFDRRAILVWFGLFGCWLDDCATDGPFFAPSFLFWTAFKCFEELL